MRIYDRYILRQLSVGFLTVLISFTALVWVTQILRTIDLSVSLQSNAGLLFWLSVYMLPPLVMLIIPFAILIAMVWVLNKLHADSEWVVFAAAGASPYQRFRPFLQISVVVSIVVAVLSLYVSPLAQKQFRSFLTEMRADFISHFLEPGVFKTLDSDLIFHVAHKRQGGALEGLFIRDLRDASSAKSYFAETGYIVRLAERTLLVMNAGTIVQESSGDNRVSIISFKSYGIDLADFSASQTQVFYKPRERTTRELLTLDLNDASVQFLYGRFVAELHDRFVQPVYPFLMVLSAFLILKRPRNTRQGRILILIAALVVAFGIRLIGFGASSIARGSPEWGALLIYTLPALVLLALLTLFAHPRLRFE